MSAAADLAMEEDDLLKHSVTRKSGNLILSLKVHPDLENFFQTTETRSSSEWGTPGQKHDFYMRDYEGEWAEYAQTLFDDYGSAYLKVTDDDRVLPNIALLRTVGLSEGKEFQINSRYSRESLIEAQKELKSIVARIYKEYISNVKVTSNLSITKIYD